MSSLSRILEILYEIEAVGSSKEKEKILKKHSDDELFTKVVSYTLDFTKRYGIKKVPIPGEFSEKSKPKKLFRLLDSLASSRGTTKAEALELASACASDQELELVKRIVNKDLRCNVGLKLASKYFDLPTKDIMLCYYAARVVKRNGKVRIDDLEPFLKKVPWNKIGISLKEDGVRDKIIIAGENVSHISRNGLPYENFHFLNDAILYFNDRVSVVSGKNNIYLDGEVISVDDDFQSQMTQVRRLESADPSIFRLKVFDLPGSKLPQIKRQEILVRAYQDLPKKYQKLLNINVCSFAKNKEDFLEQYFEITETYKKEGVVLKNLDGLYENKRSANWCKVKTFFSEDLRVIGMEEGKAGKKYAGTLGALFVDFNGVKVKVGSGFSDEERDLFKKKQPKIIEVEYKSVTKDGSLFHPSYIRPREDR